MEEENNFEARLARLNQIVQTIESETLPLEKSLALFEEGKKLIALLQNELNEAEKKVEEFLKEKEEDK